MKPTHVQKTWRGVKQNVQQLLEDGEVYRKGFDPNETILLLQYKDRFIYVASSHMLINMI